MPAPRTDHFLVQWSRWRTAARRAETPGPAGMARIDTPQGSLRVVDSRTPGPCIVITPNVIEHHALLLAALASDFRVVCFDMPGFGMSWPARTYRHTLDEGAAAVLQVLDALRIRQATLAFSSANGLYALRAARMAPERIAGLVLAQTPSLDVMQDWAHRTVPPVLRWPVAGQLAGWLLRRRAADSWYRRAVARLSDPAPFQRTAARAFACGGCFGLAGVVQGLLGADAAPLEGVTAPCTVLWGGADRSHRAASADSLARLVPHARMVRADASGHFPDLEAPEAYLRLVREHMAGPTHRAALAARPATANAALAEGVDPA